MTTRDLARVDVDLLSQVMAETYGRVGEAANRAGRLPADVEVVIAAKYIDPVDTPLLATAGVRVIGENRLQDMRARLHAGADGLVVDFIGHLQRRKVKEVLPLVRLIHSVDSAELAAEIAKRAEGDVRVLVELNVDEQPGKGGVAPAHAHAFIEEISMHDNLTVGGLMVMPAATTHPEDSRAAFARTRELAATLADRWRGRHDFTDLSMGTSQDYLVAIEEGATKVRVGRGLIDRARRI